MSLRLDVLVPAALLALTACNAPTTAPPQPDRSSRLQLPRPDPATAKAAEPGQGPNGQAGGGSRPVPRAAAIPSVAALSPDWAAVPDIRTPSAPLDRETDRTLVEPAAELSGEGKCVLPTCFNRPLARVGCPFRARHPSRLPASCATPFRSLSRASTPAPTSRTRWPAGWTLRL